FDLRLLLALRERFAARVEERRGGAGSLVDRAQGRRRAALLRGLIALRLRRRRGPLGDLDELAKLGSLVLFCGRVAERPRLFVRQLLDLSTDLGAERATTSLE